MREIKFRAWDKVGKKMWDRSIELDPYGFWTVRELHNKGDYTQMQYTGLKDKNGVEIYEGDIVKSHGGVTVVDDLLSGSCGCCSTIWGWQTEFDYDDCEVIGNVHQNPELRPKDIE